MADTDDLLKMDLGLGSRTASQIDLSWLLPDSSSSYPAQDYSSAMVDGWKDETFVIDAADLGDNANGIDDLSATLAVDEAQDVLEPVAPPAAKTSDAIPLFFDTDVNRAAPFLYSAKLNTLFVAINNPFPLVFPPLTLPPDAKIYISATFSRAEHALTELHRCANHVEEFAAARPTDRVLLCDHSAAEYTIDPATETPCIAMPYTNGTPIILRLLCFSSCAGSVRRRPVHVLARIVSSTGEIGHAAVPVRVCACPKRDLRAAERASGPLVDVHKRSMHTVDAFQTLEVVGSASDDNKVYTVTANTAEAVLVAQRVAEALHAVQRSGPTLPCDDVRAFLEGLKLGMLYDQFAAAGFDDLELLEHLDEKDLHDIGVSDARQAKAILAGCRGILVDPAKRHGCLPSVHSRIAMRVTVTRKAARR